MSSIEDHLFLIEGLARKGWSGEIRASMYKGHLSSKTKLILTVNGAYATSDIAINGE